MLQTDEIEQNTMPAERKAEMLLELDDVSFSYAQHTQGDEVSPNSESCNETALSHVNLRVHAGEFVGIIGPSGAGKTTLASLCTGAIPHHYQGILTGSVRIAGVVTTDLTLTDIAGLIGSVVQDIDAQMVASNVEDELLFGLENFGVPHDEIPGRIEQALRDVGVSDLRDRDIDTLSGGQKQKVAIAAILALHPRVMVLDEPTCALDPVSSDMIFSILRQLHAKHGITIVVIEQKVALLSQYCERLVVLSGGSIVLDASVDRALQHRQLLQSVGVNYPRTTHLVKYLQDEGICEQASLPVDVDRTVETILRTYRAETTADTRVSIEEATSFSAVPQAERNRADACLSFKHVAFSYASGVAAIRDVTFEAYPGELIALVGRNGAGKTTITKLVNGLLRPSDGEICVAGRNTRQLRISQIAHDVATLFQNPDQQLCKTTVLEEVALSCTLLGESQDRANERALAVIQHLQLDPTANPLMLSRGQRQMVALAATVVTNPKILVLDEPTCGLDYRECERIMSVVESLRAEGCCVLMVCHDMEVVLDYATCLMVVNDGEIIAQGSASNVFEKRDACEQAALYPPLLCAVSQKLVEHGFARCAHCYTRETIANALRKSLGQQDR